MLNPKRISLVPHEKPRILLIDFSEKEVKKFTDAGFNAKRGATGLYDDNKYCFPWSLQDVDIAFCKITRGSFSKLKEREPIDESLEEGPYFNTLLREIFMKKGWVVFFVDKNCEPAEFDVVDLFGTGVYENDGEYLTYQEWQRKRTPRAWNKLPIFSKFIGEAVHIDETCSESKIFEKYIKSASLKVLALDGNIMFNQHQYTVSFLITNESYKKAVLSLKLSNLYGGKTFGTIALYPDFGKSNIEVALDILSEVIMESNPELFDNTSQTWLEEYFPHTVKELFKQVDYIVEKNKKDIEEIYNKQKSELDKYNWLLGLLTNKGDILTENVADALRFLGFDVTLVDNTLKQTERKKEDLNIVHANNGFFAIGEVKSTERGASESFIADTQKHQARYSHENKVPIPNAILIINHSISLNPNLRKERFYKDKDVIDRCSDNFITAIDTYSLHQICQCILAKRKTKEEIQNFICNGHKVISTFDE